MSVREKTSAGSSDANHATEHLSHVMSIRSLVSVFAGLIFLTLVTLLAAELPLGRWEIWVSLGIASVKAALVAWFFMHLKHDRSFNGIVFLASLLFVALFLALTLMDLQSPG
ncbi:MAG: cytochrome C oxidase subunit IV family protein [Planctomycetaceae bacterium]|nr:cytochrome C oxidase subunit IV family protein [Planctomycetaceae bacterium]